MTTEEPHPTETHDDGQPRATSPGARPVAHLHVLLECDNPTASGARLTLDGVEQVILGRGEARRARREAKDGIVTLHLELPGRSLSRHHARLILWHDHWQVEDLDSRNGVFVNGARVPRWGFPNGGVFEVGHTLFAISPGLPTPRDCGDLDLGGESGPSSHLASLVPAIDERAHALARVATSRIPLLLTGEIGAGKERVARAVHGLARPQGPFVAVQAGAISAAHFEAAIFGTAVGGEDPGFVRAAHGGTLFIDEIGDLPLSAQAALLRVLDVGEVVPSGASRPVHVDARIVAATHRSLELASQQGAFRADLLARVKGYVHALAPLRERSLDVGVEVARALGPDAAPFTIEPEAGLALVSHRWPGNVRELRQRLAAAQQLAHEGVIRRAHVQLAAEVAAPPQEPATLEDAALRERLVDALRATRGNVAEVARVMAKGPTQIHRWMKRFGLNPASFRDRT